MYNPNSPDSDPKFILDDLLKASSGFQVPDNYLESLSERICERSLTENKLLDMKAASFQTPENYFQEFPNRLINQLNTVTLPESLKQNPFKLPEHYFANNADRVITKSSNPLVKIGVPTRFNRVWTYGLTACLFVAVSWFAMQFYMNSKPKDYFANITEDELLEYVFTYSADFDQNSLASLVQEEDINSLNILDYDIDDETSDLLIQMLE